MAAMYLPYHLLFHFTFDRTQLVCMLQPTAADSWLSSTKLQYVDAIQLLCLVWFDMYKEGDWIKVHFSALYLSAAFQTLPKLKGNV